MKASKSFYLLTVVGKDRPGIIAHVTGILFRHGCNLEDISMTILEGEFAMILVTCMKETLQKKIDAEFRSLERRLKLSFFWRKLRGSPKRGETHAKGSESYLITAMGRDRTGIVAQMSDLLARNHLNITDLNSKILGRGPSAVYAMMLEVDIPKNFPKERLEKSLQTVARRLKIDVNLKPVERIEF